MFEIDTNNVCSGDPTMYGRYWQEMGDKTTIVLSGWQSISYFSDVKNLCWFLESEFANAVVRLHKLVGNAVTEGHHIVVGTGSTQLFQAVLYALCHANANEPMSVVSAAPFYSVSFFSEFFNIHIHIYMCYLFTMLLLWLSPLLYNYIIMKVMKTSKYCLHPTFVNICFT